VVVWTRCADNFEFNPISWISFLPLYRQMNMHWIKSRPWW
jgi:hypothetical protein